MTTFSLLICPLGCTEALFIFNPRLNGQASGGFLTLFKET